MRNLATALAILIAICILFVISPFSGLDLVEPDQAMATFFGVLLLGAAANAVAEA